MNQTIPSNIRAKIFELATNEPLFPLGMFGLTGDEIDKEHEALIRQLLDSTDRRRLFTTPLADRLIDNFGADDLKRLTEFLLLMLQRIPEKRPSAKQLLSSAFVADDVAITHQWHPPPDTQNTYTTPHPQ